MSDFTDQSELSNQSRSNIVSSFEFALEFMFFIAQRSKIADIVIAALRTIQMQQLTSSFTSETQATAQSVDFIKEWTIDEIDFFDSDVDEDDSVINVDRHVFYKNIYAFVDRLKDTIIIRDDDKFRTILFQCFWDAAFIWHFIELFDMKKNLLRQINLSFWYQALINRFKKRTSLTLSAFQNFKYIMTDAKVEKDSRLFAQQIFRSAKTVNMNSIHNQLIIAWNNLDWHFRINILELIVTIFIRKFLNQFDFMSDIWHEMIRSQSQNQSKLLRDRFQNSRRTQNYSEYSFRSNASFSISYQNQNAYSNNQSFYQFDHRQYERFEYRNRDIRLYNSRDNRFIDSQYFKKKSARFASVLLFARQSLQITNENASQNASDSSYFGIKSKNYKEKYRAYVMKEDEHEHVNEIEDASSEDEYYHESNSELNYYNSDFDDHDQFDVETNFFIFTRVFRCRKCRAVFSSNNQLHKHVKQNVCKNFNIFTHFIIIKEEIMNEHVNFVMNISIVKSSVDFSKNIDTSFEFREWIYVKIMISLSLKREQNQVCLDIDCSVTLIDKKFVALHESHYQIRHMTTSLNVRDLKINKHEIFEYFIVIIYVVETLKENQYENSFDEKFIW
jgi:hypothetical protein